MPDYRVKRTRPPAWAPTFEPKLDCWNTMVLSDGRSIERFVTKVDNGMIWCEDGTSFYTDDIKHTWALWADLSDHEIDDDGRARY